MLYASRIRRDLISFCLMLVEKKKPKLHTLAELAKVTLCALVWLFHTLGFSALGHDLRFILRLCPIINRAALSLHKDTHLLCTML